MIYAKEDLDRVEKYKEGGDFSTKELREIADSYLMCGEVFMASEIYEEKLEEKIPVKKLIGAGKQEREFGHYKVSLLCYKVAIQNIDEETIELKEEIIKGIRFLKDREMFGGLQDFTHIDLALSLLERKIKK
jgi:hypothetical protein